MNLSILSERIRQKRKAKKLTQADLADQLRISEMTIRRWETGKSSPRIEDIQKLAKELDTSVDYLMGMNEPNAIHVERVTNNVGMSPTMAYWGGVLDNARKAVNDGQNLSLIYTLLSDAAGTIKTAMGGKALATA